MMDITLRLAGDIAIIGGMDCDERSIIELSNRAFDALSGNSTKFFVFSHICADSQIWDSDIIEALKSRGYDVKSLEEQRIAKDEQ